MMDWFLSALWDGLIICLIFSALALAFVLVAIGVEDLLTLRRRRKRAKRWAQILQARRELTVDELRRAERVEPVQVFKTSPEAVARADR